MKKSKYLIFFLIALAGLFNGCNILDLEDEDTYDLNTVQSVVPYAEGILLKAYRNIPANHNYFNQSYASDDAVTNVSTSQIKTVVSGGWTSSSNPFSVWNTAYESIFYINTFLEEMGDVEWFWKTDTTNTLFAQKLKGEAYGLRAWNYFNLLQAHAGRGSNGEILGVPIVDHVLNVNAPPSEYQIPRSTFNDLVKFIIADCDSAIALLPDRWLNTGDGDVNLAVGSKNTNRINGLAVRLVKAKTLLYAASPAFSDGTYTYQMAAEEAAALMKKNNNLSMVNFSNNKNVEFYSNPNVIFGNTHPEVLWYSSSVGSSSGWEVSNFTPSLYGQGLTNPTQDLVNAFPMKDGTPTPVSKINSGDPYSGRDPRLAKYILFNGAQFIRGSDTIIIKTTAGSQDALGSANIYATKTGYYLKKFMNVSVVNLDPTVNSGGLHYYTYARYTDVLLMFAEAANQAAGPDGEFGGYSAREVIDAIRDRAGITSNFFVSIQDKNGLAEIIRNERRLEMCFEEQRFWDLRRWNMTNEMKKPVSGVEVSADGSTYSYLVVESRSFANYQIYGPIPYTETLKYNLIQNEGWQ